MAQLVKYLPAMQAMRVQSLGQEKAPGEGDGNPLHSCLGNPMDRGAQQQTTVHRVTESGMTEQPSTHNMIKGPNKRHQLANSSG